ncbi:hypothetical protein EJ069_12555 [Mesorhizobium sp. M2A.F.Ca.ET.043.05.1.1]|uniref:hypothetical protein n=1 Tax=Mesorhizobium sp. M2A.F.Ca.ET.043.05.1.1 TaxID=2493671 RepID=UPI000F763059|nr:hypothetical protein [Mesorhizobium sp. M2A.F.Ca.ET.043.05.1.1]AZO15475.1 hypothetical protein EJ069_12555 [Mesorhizobium sp. M2A.F.Ca.ET.043.05.1.1]
MTSPVGSQHPTGVVYHSSKPQKSSETFPGKSAESVGHLAKVSVAETDAGEPNAQGKAASRIARMDLTVLSPTGAGEESDTATEAPDTAGDVEAA